MPERTGVIFMNGHPLTLLGKELKVGDQAPDCEVLDHNLKPVNLAAFRGKVVILVSVPSLDTPVCDLETRRFNQEAAGLGEKIVILTISMDLPFAQKRWCGAAGVEKVITLSDHRQASFGAAYGTLIKELRLLARTVFVVDPGGIIRYIQVVKDIGQEPEYTAVLEAVKKLIQ